MLWRESEEAKGGILADDMGLGKTLSMIALILKSREEEYERSPKPRTRHETAAGHMTDASESSGSDDEEPEDECKPKGGTLIVYPLSLMNHWEDEIIKHVKKQKLSVTTHQ